MVFRAPYTARTGHPEPWWVDLTLPDPDSAETVRTPPYHRGTRRGFLTGDKPSRRAERILNGIGASAATAPVE